MTEIGLELRAAALSLLGGAGADEKASRAIADVLERAADKIEDLRCCCLDVPGEWNVKGCPQHGIRKVPYSDFPIPGPW